MKKIKITQIKSGIDRPERQKLTLRALGLNKMNASREVEATAQILGMVRTVNHLIRIEETTNDEVAENSSRNISVNEVSPATIEEPTAAPTVENPATQVPVEEPVARIDPEEPR